MRYYLKPSCGKDEDSQYFYTLLLQVQFVQPFWKIDFQYPVKLNIDRPYSPVILLVGINLREILYVCAKVDMLENVQGSSVLKIL